MSRPELTTEYGFAPESEAVVMKWLDGGDRRFGHFVNGEWMEASGAPRETTCPADGRRLATVFDGTEGEVASAVAAAKAALAGWQKTTGPLRARHLYGLARAIQRHARHLSVLESLDNGKPIRESRDLDIPLVARHFYHHAGWAQILEGEFPHTQAVGVVGQIIPWNFPLLMLAWKVAPALAAGATVVLKPAEHTPLTALYFAELVAEAGLPPGVFNLVTGAGETGAALVRHPDVDKIAFTGSTEVGREIRKVTAGSGKHLSLELGGKSPFVVFDTADLDGAVEGVVDGIWFNQGQVCCAGSRLLIQESVEEAVLDRLRTRMESLRLGHPLEKNVDMGAIVDQAQLDRIAGYVRSGQAEGARVWQPSWWLPEAGEAQGLFYPPTLCTGADPSSRLATEEIFGPVVVASTFRTPAEAVALANNTRYGLAASIWTEDLNVALEVASRIKAGTVWVNCTNLFDAAAGFGGYRESGFGREGGREGMWEYLVSTAEPPHMPWTPADSAGLRGERAESGPTQPPDAVPQDATAGSLDRTRKLYIGGRQVRPDGGYSLAVRDARGQHQAEIPRGNRKDIRNAVEAAAKARPAWAGTSAHGRAQVLYFTGENLAARQEEFTQNLATSVGMAAEAARSEVEASISLLFRWAAWADKVDGLVHRTPFRNVTLAMREPAGTVGIRCGEAAPLAGAVGALGSAVAMGCAVVLIPSQRFPTPALDLVQVLETSDVPSGVVNLVTGLHREIVPALASHDGVDEYWDFAADDLTTEAEELSAGNLKRVWSPRPSGPDWTGLSASQEREVLRRATRVKNIWVPYGA